ncbi:MAG TPA: hypothetical protein VJC03_05250, partial [bacterium]|nr:hypothetical protein [bacterium]
SGISFSTVQLISISTSVFPGVSVNHTLTSLSQGATYYFKIRTADEWDLWSEFSDVSSARSRGDETPPGDVSNFTAVDTPQDFGGSITLSWDLSPDDGSGENDVEAYYIYHATFVTLASPAGGHYTLHVTRPGGTTNYTDETVSDGTEYYYRIEAYDGWNFSTGTLASAVPVKNWQEVAEEGGTLDLGDGVEIDVPDQAASEKIYFLVRRPDPEEYESAILSPLAQSLGIVREIMLIKESERQTIARKSISFIRSYVASRSVPLNKNITLKLSYEGALYTDERRLRLFWLDEGNDVWQMLHNSAPDSAVKKVVASVPHLSYYGVMEFMGAPYLLEKGKTYVYPQPASGSELFFKFYLGNVADVTIKVFNVNGDMVFEEKEIYDLTDIGMAREIRWDTGRIASGVYIWILEAEGSGRKEKVKKKLAIVK